jgi:hypothetical protein
MTYGTEQTGTQVGTEASLMNRRARNGLQVVTKFNIPPSITVTRSRPQASLPSLLL